MQKIKTRYAPSPTGIPHVGNIRTALFNFLLARNKKGEFILRIEDTDQKRSTKEYIGNIEASLKLLRIDWDSKYLQSERLNVYQKHLEILKKKGVAYEDEGAWRFKIDSSSEKISWNDLAHHKVEFPTHVIEDFVIVKSDGFPTYHFASVVDDHEMEISHVLRGDEWISSTPKHLLIYQAFGWQPPQFCHLPAILGADHKKLSKRAGAKSTKEYLGEGYLPEALTNFLALLGWAPGDNRELFSLDELICEFSLEKLNKNSPIFNIEKLDWFNRKYLQQLSIEMLVTKVKAFYSSSERSESRSSRRVRTITNQKLARILNLIRDRLVILADFDKYASIFFEKGSQEPPSKEKVDTAKKAILSIKNWDTKSIKENLDQFTEDNNLEASDFKNTLRLAVFADNTPPIYESLSVLTKEETQKRLEEARQK